jgi:DNA-binding XRE family transcriptional regulator
MRRKCVQRQPTERLERLNSPRTEFARWRATCGLLQVDAAGALGISSSTVQAYEYGNLVPSYCVRVVMRILAERQKVPEPWIK